MASAVGSGAVQRVRSVRKGRPVATPVFEWAVLLTAGWMLGGAYADAWAHKNISDLESFFTIWHAILYSGFGALFGIFMWALAVNWRNGYPLQRAMPTGYELSLVGVGIFIFGGVGDGLWHTLFGLEDGLEGLLSPSHISLMICFGFIVTGALRVAWRKKSATIPLLALVSVAFMAALFSLITLLIHPVVTIYAAPEERTTRPFWGEMNGVAGMLFETIFFMGLVLLVLRRWRLPFGSITFLFLVAQVPMAIMTNRPLVVPVALVAGLLLDALLQVLKPSPLQPAAFHFFAFVMPILVYSLYFLSVYLTLGIWWSAHVWVGVLLLSGVASWLLSYLVLPPPIPVTADQ